MISNGGLVQLRCTSVDNTVWMIGAELFMRIEHQELMVRLTLVQYVQSCTQEQQNFPETTQHERTAQHAKIAQNYYS